jgi:hypothetical protein
MTGMDRVDQLIQQYAASVESGDADPTPFLEQVEGAERERLERRIELFHMASPAWEEGLERKWDPVAYRGSRAERIVGEIVEETRCPAGEWPELLPELMAERELERETVVERLASGIGATGPDQVAKVGEYFHGMTWGSLDSRGVTDSVLDRLAEILDTSRDALRRAGDGLGRRRPDSGAVFARRPSFESLNFGMDRSPERGMRTPAAEPDQIDLLFTSREADREPK